MIAKFFKSEDGQLGIQFSPETTDEQLLLEIFTRETDLPFRFHGWEYNGLGRPLREGLTLVRGSILKSSLVDRVADSVTQEQGKKLV